MSQDMIAALLEERRGYVVRNLPERVAAVDEALAKLGHQPTREAAAFAPAETATAAKPKKR